MQVVFTPLAERQIEGIYDYIAAQSGDRRADIYVSRIIDFCKRLAIFPLRGLQREDYYRGYVLLDLSAGLLSHS